MTDPEPDDRLVVVLGVEGHVCLVQNLVLWSQRGSQEHKDPHWFGEAKELQQHRLCGIQMQREWRCDQIPEETSNT